MKRKPKRRPDGRWQRRMKGKLFISSISQEDADRQAKEYERMIKDGMNRNADTMTVRQYASAWHPRYRSEISEDEYNSECHRIDIINQVIGNLLIKDVKPSDIMDVYKLYCTGKSASLIGKTQTLLSGIFESAMEDGYIRYNPCKSKKAKPPKGSEGSHRELEEWERALIESRTDDPLYPIIMTMLYTGMRPQEALGIVIERDVDFENKLITIHEVRKSSGKKAYLSGRGKTKEATGRIVPLFSPLENVLRGKTGRLFVLPNGDLPSSGKWDEIWHSYVTRSEEAVNGHEKRWHHMMKGDPLRDKIKALRKAGKIEESDKIRYADWTFFTVRSYDLRHEFCTWACYNDVEMNTLIKWMGHTTSKMVQQVYDHVNKKRFDREAQKLENAIKSSQNSSQVVYIHASKH